MKTETVSFFKNKKGEWCWHSVCAGRIIADSGESYKRFGACFRALERHLDRAKYGFVKIELPKRK